ncbi:MAG TPA: hypothetical protein DEB06_05310 [Phycisphaerales bacterium]|nr:hypothetical protein [Phycisphaerales bacterium]
MTRLRLRQNASNAPHAPRFDSDADVLHFPEGGVFARSRPGHRHEPSLDAPPPLRIVHEVESAFDQVQRRLDELNRQIDTAFAPRANPSDDDSWRPSAA